jgi:hypothetical protein
MLSVSRTKNVCGPARGGYPCQCEGRCLGYDTQDECPPLIVFATLAMELAQVSAPSLALSRAKQAGAR